MKISTLSAAGSCEPLVFGIELDEECFLPPQGLRVAGLLWKARDDGKIDDDLIDTIIAFSLSGVEVIVEVPPSEDVEHDYLVSLAGNAGFSVSAIPPTTAEDLPRWAHHCRGLASALLTTPNFGKELFPATGYLSYLVAETFAGIDGLAPSDEYARRRFSEAVPTEWSDAAKVEMRAEMEDLLGGPDGLRDYLAALIAGIAVQADRLAVEATAQPSPPDVA